MTDLSPSYFPPNNPSPLGFLVLYLVPNLLPICLLNC